MAAFALEERALFGGAVLASLPASFVDVSAIRDVPDSQELWLDEASDVSLIVEFVEHMPHVADEGSAQFFWSDVASLNCCAQAAPDVVAPLTAADVPRFDSRAVAASLAGGAQTIPPQATRARDHPPAYVCLANVRLPCVATDVLVTVNWPLRGTGAEAAAAAASAQALLRGVLATLHVVDYGLFGAPPGA